MILIKLLDGRSHFYQWDTKRYVVVDCKCDQVHFRNSLSVPSIDIEVEEKDGLYIARVPEELLQDTKDITVYVYHESADDGAYTEESESFRVTPRPKPSGYVYTPTEQVNMKELKNMMEELKDSMPDIILY